MEGQQGKIGNSIPKKIENSIPKKIEYPNPPDPYIPDAATLREQWKFAVRQYSKWYSHAWGTAIFAGGSLFALGWYIKGGNPLDRSSTDDKPPTNNLALPRPELFSLHDNNLKHQQVASPNCRAKYHMAGSWVDYQMSNVDRRTPNAF